jgi:hypothetical protein
VVAVRDEVGVVDVVGIDRKEPEGTGTDVGLIV